MTTTLSFFGGAHELGGTQVLLDDNGVRIFLDFGVNFQRSGNYFLYPNAPKKFNALAMLLRNGVYPDLPGIYRTDHLAQMGRPSEPKGLDAILITHAHLDHAAGMNFVRPDVDIWMHPMSKAVLYTLQMFSGMPHQDFVEMNWFNEIVPNIPTWNNDNLERILTGRKARFPRAIKTFHPSEPFTVGHVTIEPYSVDHSLPGSAAFLIHTSNGVIAYTGDIRFSTGRRREHTEAFVEACQKAGVDYLLCEGSLIDRKHPGSEDSLANELAEVIKDVKGLVAISYPPRDIDRIATLYNVAQRTGRKLALDTKQAKMLELEAFKGRFKDKHYKYPHLGQKYIRVYTPRKGSGLLTTAHDHLADRDFYMWEREFLRRPETVTADDLRQHPEEYIWYLSPANLDDLLEVQPPPGSMFIRSNPEPYTEEMKLGQGVLMNWLRNFNLLQPRERFKPLHKYSSSAIPMGHVTGHMSYTDTKELIEGISPGLLIPIHTAVPVLFFEMFGQGLSQNMAFVERGEVISLKGRGNYEFVKRRSESLIVAAHDPKPYQDRIETGNMLLYTYTMDSTPEPLKAEVENIDFCHTDK